MVSLLIFTSYVSLIPLFSLLNSKWELQGGGIAVINEQMFSGQIQSRGMIWGEMLSDSYFEVDLCIFDSYTQIGKTFSSNPGGG